MGQPPHRHEGLLVSQPTPPFYYYYYLTTLLSCSEVCAQHISCEDGR